VRIALTHALCWPEVRRGAERFLPALGAALARRGHEVVHLSAGWDSGRVERDGVTTIRMRRIFRGLYRHEADFGRRVLPRLAAGRFDAVHSLGRHDALASIRAARLHPGRRTVFTDLGLPNPKGWTWVSDREVRVAEKVVAGIDVYSGMSQCAVDSLASSSGRYDGVVVPGGVDLGSFVPAPERERNPTILFSGAIAERRKGVPTLLEALPLIAAKEPDVELWLSGPGDTEPFLAEAVPAAREKTRSLGLGDPALQHERYGRAWITCLPSINDSFGMALLESLCCGTPIVTTTHSAPQELVDEGVTGELCEPEDAESLARACLRAFELARDPHTPAACRETAEPYDWDGGLAPLCESLYRGSLDRSVSFPPASREPVPAARGAEAGIRTRGVSS
jgi:phosphatidyl-myo-inositol alpha-mannosyltransferase